jgi:GrpE protein
MPLRQIRPGMAAASAVLAGLTGVAVAVLTGRPVVGLVALVGALAAAALPWIGAARPAAVDPLDCAAEPDRASLVNTCIYLRDRVTSTALASRLDQALEQVGVSLVDPTGQRFDPSHHEAGGALATADDALVGTIAAVEAPGYADRGVLLRAPVVTVYQRRAS